MLTRLFDYELPEDLIARYPTAERDGARLLLVQGEALLDRQVRDLAEHLPQGALLVVNDTRVEKARLLGVRPTGGKIEVFLVERFATEDPRELSGLALVKTSKPLRVGQYCQLEGDIEVEIKAERGEAGLVQVCLRHASDVAAAIETSGHIPLPPYLGRKDESSDLERYQTLFAEKRGAVAAPTAGLHLSERVLAAIAARGIERVSVTLHVSLGTFQPVKVDDLDQHPMHEERYEISEAAVSSIRAARAAGRPIVAVGTTVVRALESAAQLGHLQAGSGRTRLLIQPGYPFRLVDQLLTNFHLPQSTLLALVSAFAGRESMLRAYEHAIRERYRFFSYGDAMLLTRH